MIKINNFIVIIFTFSILVCTCAQKIVYIDRNYNPLIDNTCIKAIWEIKKPIITKIGPYSAIAAKDKTNPPYSDYAIVEIEILNFDKNFPPVIKVFNEQTNQLIDTIEFYPLRYPCEAAMSTPLKVPIFLSYDKAPWQNPNQEPKARITRIELHLDIIDHVDIVYIQLKEGIFVVPVVWHNVVDNSKNQVSYVNNMHIKDMFWTAPSGKHYNDINSIWAQAGIQFLLITINVPFRLSDIPTDVVNKSSASDCKFDWNNDISNKNGVDIYAVYDLKFQGAPVTGGVGNCFAYGYIFITAFKNSLFTSPNTNAQGRAELVAHEFGHYLGDLPHDNNDPDNLMFDPPGWKINSSQCQLVRTRLKDRIMKAKGYNESK